MIKPKELKKAEREFKAQKEIKFTGKEPDCQYCGQKSNLTTGREIYPFLKYLFHKHFYVCRPCGAYVGCHPGSINPLGVLANKEHREAKMKAHKTFDPIWQTGKMLRSDAYQWLADQMGIKKKECHIGQFSIADCARVVEIVHNYLNPKPTSMSIIRRSTDGSEFRRIISTVETKVQL